MKLTILSPGPLATVQDAGRFGYMRCGIGQSGVMDPAAYRAANRLVGNASGEAVLELTLMGASLSFDGTALCALTGADMSATLDGEPVPRYEAFPVAAGQVLRLGFARCGCRSYLAVRGGIAVPPVMGSRSTDLKSRIGGPDGRRLQAGDVLPIGEPTGRPLGRALTPPPLADSVTVRVIEGPQADAFTREGLDTLYGSVYTVTPDSDRMGIRLSGPPVASVDGTDIVSDGIVFGSIQIPGNGLPIVLMADHQTAGGYAKAATVISEDLPLLSQLKPGGTVRFVRTALRDVQPHRSPIAGLLRLLRREG